MFSQSLKQNMQSVSVTHKQRSKISLIISSGMVYRKTLYGNILSSEKVLYMMKHRDWWERQYSIPAGKHMQQNVNMVLRCGEHSNRYMYVEHGALLALER